MGLNGALACSDEAEPTRQQLIGRRAATQAALRERLDRAKATGDLPATADPATLAAFVMTVAQGMAVQAKAGADRNALNAIVNRVLATWLYRRAKIKIEAPSAVEPEIGPRFVALSQSRKSPWNIGSSAVPASRSPR